MKTARVIQPDEAFERPRVEIASAKIDAGDGWENALVAVVETALRRHPGRRRVRGREKVIERFQERGEEVEARQNLQHDFEPQELLRGPREGRKLGLPQRPIEERE